MAQVLKTEMRRRIEAAALRQFADHGYAGASIASIAAEAGTAPANVYRYVTDKPALFAAVIPPEVRDRHVELLDARIAGLSDDASRSGSTEAVGGPATELLDWWIEHRLQVVVLLDRAEGTPYADEPAAFVRHLTEHAVRAIGEPVGDVHRRLLSIVFDNTRRAIAAILHSSADPGELRQLIAGFWCYQLPGLDGLMDWMSKTD